MSDLKMSGYNEEERFNILSGGVKTLVNLQEKVDAGQRPFFRNHDFKREERDKEKKNKKYNWHKGKLIDEKKYQTIMFVEPTPNGELVKQLREVEEKFQIADDKRIKFIELAGTKVVNLLEKKDPFEENCKNKQ